MNPIRVLTVICAALTAAVVVDAIGVGAPGLAVVAVPFVAALLLLARSPRAGAVVAFLGCLLVGLTAGAYIASNGTDLQSGFDALYVYVAGPLAVVGLVVTVAVLRARHAVQG